MHFLTRYGMLTLALGATSCASIVGLDDDYSIGDVGAGAGAGTTASGTAGGSTPTGGDAGNGGTAGTGGTAGGGQGGNGTAGNGGQGGAPPCLVALSDDFNGGIIDTTKWTPWGSGASVHQVNGALEITVPAGPGNIYAGVFSASSYDLTGCAAQIRIDAFTQGPHTQTFFYWGTDRYNRFGIRKWETNLYFSLSIGGVNSSPNPLPFVAGQMSWWRLSEAGGELRWETSPDGHSWTLRRRETNPGLPIHDMAINMGAGAGDGTNPTSARLDDFN